MVMMYNNLRLFNVLVNEVSKEENTILILSIINLILQQCLIES